MSHALLLPLALLTAVGRAGPNLPALAIVAGAVLPELGALGVVLLIPAVALLLFSTVALAEAGPLEPGEAAAVLGLAVVNLLLTPVMVHVLATPLGFGAASGWLVLMAGCPAAGGAVLLAAVLGLPVRQVVLSQLLCFALLPLTAPLLAALLLDAELMDPGALLARVALLVGLPALAALAARRVIGRRRHAAACAPLQSCGLVALTVIGLAAGHGLPALLVEPALLAVAVPGVLFVSAAGAALGMLAALGLSARLVAGFALGGGIRNVSTIWGATLGLAPPEGSAILQLASVWVVAAPALIAGVLRMRAGVRRAAV